MKGLPSCVPFLSLCSTVVKITSFGVGQTQAQPDSVTSKLDDPEQVTASLSLHVLILEMGI